MSSYHSPRFIKDEDFKHKVTLPTPHDGAAVRDWLYSNQIPFNYTTYGSIDYFMTTEADAVLFALRWS